ncbi:MAG: ATP-binding protein, partial [Ignisphaera sp.]
MNRGPSYTIYVEELDKVINFVDREDEALWFRDIVSRGTAFPVTIYGPEGCGKTAFLRYMVRGLGVSRDMVIVYVDALEHFDVGKALFASYKEVFEFIQDLISIPLGAS